MLAIFGSPPSLHLVPPLTGKGRWSCDFARAGFRQDVGKLPLLGDGFESINRDLFDRSTYGCMGKLLKFQKLCDLSIVILCYPSSSPTSVTCYNSLHPPIAPFCSLRSLAMSIQIPTSVGSGFATSATLAFRPWGPWAARGRPWSPWSNVGV